MIFLCIYSGGGKEGGVNACIYPAFNTEPPCKVVPVSVIGLRRFRLIFFQVLQIFMNESV